MPEEEFEEEAPEVIETHLPPIKRVYFTDPDFLLIFFFALFIDILDIIIEILSLFFVVPKIIGIIIDIIAAAIIIPWMISKGKEIEQSKRARQGALKRQLEGLATQLKSLKAGGRFTGALAGKFANLEKLAAGAIKSRTGGTILKGVLAFIGEIIILLGLIPWWTISVLSILKEK